LGSDLSLWAAGDTTQSRSDIDTISITPIIITPSSTTGSFGAVVGGGVLSPEVVQLQPHCALPVVPRDGGTALHHRPVECETTIIINSSAPFQPLAGRLSHPLHAVTAEGEPGGLADEAEPSSGLLEGSHEKRIGPAPLHPRLPHNQAMRLLACPVAHPSGWARTSLSLFRVSMGSQWVLSGVSKRFRPNLTVVSMGSVMSRRELNAISMRSLWSLSEASMGSLWGLYRVFMAFQCLRWSL